VAAGGRARLLHEFRSTRDPAVWPRPPEGRDRPALLIPGFLANDASLSRLSAWLRSGGFRTYRSGIVLNTACMEPLLETLERRLVRAVERVGRKAVVVGQSRGGTLGRALAVRRPELVDELVTLGSPVLDPLAVHARAWVSIGAVGLLGTLGVPGCFGFSCRAGACCERARADALRPFPGGVRYLAVYSRSDEVVKWEACLDPGAEQVEADSTHIGMAFNISVWSELASRV
jgi:pimeloyl-ACP methyl ester carboxylesterase